MFSSMALERTLAGVLFLVLLALSANVAFSEGESGEPSFVKKQIVRMDCDELKVVRRQLRAGIQSAKQELRDDKFDLRHASNNLREANEAVAALQATLKKEKNRDAVKRLRQNLRAAKNSARQHSREVKVFQRNVSREGRTLDTLNNDLRIADKVSKQNRC